MVIRDDFHLKSKTYSGCLKYPLFGRFSNRGQSKVKGHEIIRSCIITSDQVQGSAEGGLHI